MPTDAVALYRLLRVMSYATALFSDATEAPSDSSTAGTASSASKAPAPAEPPAFAWALDCCESFRDTDGQPAWKLASHEAVRCVMDCIECAPEDATSTAWLWDALDQLLREVGENERVATELHIRRPLWRDVFGAPHEEQPPSQQRILEALLATET